MTQPKAMLCALAAFFAWVVVDVVIKLASVSSPSPFAIMAIMGSVAVVAVISLAAIRRDMAALRPRSLRGQVVIFTSNFAINCATVIALKHLPLTVYYIAIFTAPPLIAVLSSLLKHEKLTWIKIACLIAGFIGVVIAIAPRGGAGGEWIGYATVAICVVAFAVYTVTIRKLSATDTADSMQLSAAVATGAGGLIGMLFQTSHNTVFFADWKMPMFLAAAGGINLLGNILYNKALKHTSSTNVAQLQYTQIIWGAVMGYLIWREILTWNLVLGSVLIIAAGLVVAARTRQESEGLMVQVKEARGKK
jgi:drug/metabolite transporter (DMT)-like permease